MKPYSSNSRNCNYSLIDIQNLNCHPFDFKIMFLFSTISRILKILHHKSLFHKLSKNVYLLLKKKKIMTIMFGKSQKEILRNFRLQETKWTSTLDMKSEAANKCQSDDEILFSRSAPDKWTMILRFSLSRQKVYSEQTSSSTSWDVLYIKQSVFLLIMKCYSVQNMYS